MKILPTLTAVLLAFVSVSSYAQFIIEGRSVPYDTLTHTWLATVPQRFFSHDQTLTVKLAEGWKDASIEGQAIAPTAPNGSPVGKSHVSFPQLSATSRLNATATDSLGRVFEGDIMFTFLPIVQLVGDFGYDYQEGTFIFSHPDSLRTDTLSAKIKWRGGTTNAPDKHKRNYKVKFPEDHRFLGLRNDNNWMLDAGQPDVFRMRNRMAMDLWNDMARQPYYAAEKPNARNGVRGGMVEVFLGNEYRGLYNFSELMDRKQLKLKKVDEETGEIHGCLYKGVNWDKTQMFNDLSGYDNTKDTFYGFEMKYPDLDDSDTVDWAPLVEATNYVRAASNSEFEQHVGDYFDLPVIIDYSLFLSVVNGVDNSGKNMYWAIFDKATDKRLTPAPWDLDATFGQRWGGMLVGGDSLASPEYKTDVDVFVFFRLYRDNACHFNDSLRQRYQELRQPGKPLSTDSLLSRLTMLYRLVKDSGAAQREAERWSGDSDMWGDVIDFDAEYAYIAQWIKDHTALIDKCGLPIYYTKEFFDFWAGIHTPAPSSQPSPHIYDLSGRKITNGTTTTLKPGLYIRGGTYLIVR